jgi:hypothetical protein
MWGRNISKTLVCMAALVLRVPLIDAVSRGVNGAEV